MSYKSVAEMIRMAEDKNTAIWEIVLENECAISEADRGTIFEALKRRYEVMKQSASRALESGLPSAGRLIEGIASDQYSYSITRGGLGGGFINLIMARALSCSEVNASMGKICAAPTAGSCGILPAVIITVAEKLNSSEDDILKAILTASGFGAVIMKNATVAGADGGCQAECGVAAAMSAAAAVFLSGGNNEMSAHAGSLALINSMGLICDPIAGLVESPCAQRNASQAVNAIISADMALAGMKSVIPFDEVVSAMYQTGKLLPSQLKETAQGGIAATPTGKKIASRIFG